MQLQVRKIEAIDAPILASLARQTFFDTFTGTCTEQDMQEFLVEYFNEARIKSEILMEGNFYFFAEVDGVPVGFLQFMEDYSGFPEMKKWKALELKRLYIQHAFHKQGIAQFLMDFILNYAQENKYEVVWLGVWEHNERAKRFYAKYGFVDSGHTHDFPIGSTPQTDNWLWKFL